MQNDNNSMNNNGSANFVLKLIQKLSIKIQTIK